MLLSRAESRREKREREEEVKAIMNIPDNFWKQNEVKRKFTVHNW